MGELGQDLSSGIRTTPIVGIITVESSKDTLCQLMEFVSLNSRGQVEMKPTIPQYDRRQFLYAMVGVSTGLMISPLGHAATRQQGELKLHHLHTGERLTVTYADDGGYLRDGLSDVNRFLRDFRTGEIYPIEPALLDILNAARLELSQNGTFEIISGYRSPKTNAALRAHGRGVAKRSLHMQGRALDIRLTGVTSADLRRFCVTLRRGGVGYYQKSNFVHVDTGRVRTW